MEVEANYWGKPTYYVRQAPHLGSKRYYVCPADLIYPEQVKHFGLYWYKGGKFYKQKESETFRRDLMLEHRLLIHAMRKQDAEPDNKNVMMKGKWK